VQRSPFILLLVSTLVAHLLKRFLKSVADLRFANNYVQTGVTWRIEGLYTKEIPRCKFEI
jgi:hypothetical protein